MLNLSLQVVAEQQEKTTLEETLTSEISNLQEQLGKSNAASVVRVKPVYSPFSDLECDTLILIALRLQLCYKA